MKSTELHLLKSGVIIASALIGYFLLMNLLNLAAVVELRAFNGVILASGVFITIKMFKESNFKTRFNYISGLGIGFFTGLTAAITFALFIAIYTSIDTDFLVEIIAQKSQRSFLNPLSASAIIFIEGLASGALFSFISMQYLKSDDSVFAAVENG